MYIYRAGSGTATVLEKTLNQKTVGIQDVFKAIEFLNKNKSAGHDDIPAKVLQSKSCINFLHRLFCVCFETGKIPDSWNYGIFTLILKYNNTGDKRDASNYRGITVTTSIYKAYCALLNERLTKWAEENDIIEEEQNGFRRHRSTIDHLSTLSNIIETRKKAKKSTYVAFIDFSKAYDRVNHKRLWDKLYDISINGKMFEAVKSIYNNIQCAVKIDNYKTQ